MESHYHFFFHRPQLTVTSPPPCPLYLLSTHLNQLAPPYAPKDGWLCLSAFCWQFVLVISKQGDSCAANDLGGKNDICVYSSVCLCVRADRHALGHVAPCLCVLAARAGTGENSVCVYSTAYYMQLTSSHGWSLLPGINHGDLWQANPAEVIHGAAFMTFHSGTQLGPLAQCAHSFL